MFQPQFRGSYGFGRRFEQAGYKQWGMAMQDDITDGVQYLIRQGIADPQRICIYGASYGGYAALWGLVKTPDLYRCGISFAGVTDIGNMFKDWSDTNSSQAGREWRRFLVGNPDDDKARFDAVSPLKHADRIKAPVLLMHGEEDVRVPIEHGTKMVRALMELHKEYEWKSFPLEGHGLYYTDHRNEFYNTLLGFLDKYIGPASTASKPPTGTPPLAVYDTAPVR
ncbi:S9 family peptidase [Chitinimonas sp.]|uniref:S9 family peptidase n=1 Tax=Chitinimonas sp. TaxID=1934313 RepID=UPI002F928F3E